MSDRMDIDWPAALPSRDPRIANRQNRPPLPPSPRVNTGSLDLHNKPSVASPIVQNTTPPAAASGHLPQSGNGFTRALFDSIRTGALLERDEYEKEKSQKQTKVVERLFQRAKVHPGFPATLKFFEETSQEEKIALQSISDAIEKRKSRWRQVSSTLETALGFAISQTPSNVEERFAKLERDFEEKLTKQRNEYEERLNKYRNVSDEKIAHLQSQIGKAKVDAEEAKKRTTQTSAVGQNNRLSLLEKSVQVLQGRIADITGRLDTLASTEGSSGLKSTSNDTVMSRLGIQEGDFAKLPQPNPNLDATVLRLSDQIRGLQTLHNMGNDFGGSEVTELKKNLSRLTEEVNSLKVAHRQVSDDTKSMGVNMSRSNSTISRSVSQLSVTLESLQRIIVTMKAGFQSLETRYNNLSTEPMVKNMAAVMQEMYPTTALTEQVTRLKSGFENELSTLKTTVDRLNQAQNGGLGEIGRLRGEFGQLSQSFQALSETSRSMLLDLPKVTAKVDGLNRRTDGLEQWKNDSGKQLEQKEATIVEVMGKVDALKDITSTLVQWIDGHGMQVEQMLKSTETEDAIQELKNEGSSLKREIDTLVRDVSGRVAQLEETASTMKSDIKASTDRAKSQTKEISSLLGREAVHKSVKSQETTPRRAQEPEPQQEKESPAGPTTPNIVQMAETNPALALREKKKKKKRPRSPTFSEDGKAPTRVSNSPGGVSSAGGSSPAESREKKKEKKKKKRKTNE